MQQEWRSFHIRKARPSALQSISSNGKSFWGCHFPLRPHFSFGLDTSPVLHCLELSPTSTHLQRPPQQHTNNMRETSSDLSGLTSRSGLSIALQYNSRPGELRQYTRAGADHQNTPCAILMETGLISLQTPMPKPGLL